MTVFIDASALVGIVADEPDRAELVHRLSSERVRLWSALSSWEAVSALQSTYKRPVDLARARVTEMAEAFQLTLVTIGGPELSLALDAYQTYGKGRHRAKLNFGDCFAYACAKTNGASLLYKGDDFAHTDLA